MSGFSPWKEQGKIKKSAQSRLEVGGEYRSRTDDLFHAMEAL